MGKNYYKYNKAKEESIEEESPLFGVTEKVDSEYSTIDKEIVFPKKEKVIDRIKEAEHICQIIRDCSNKLIRGRMEQIKEIQKFYPSFDNRANVMLHNPHFGIKKFRYYGLQRIVN